MWVNVLHIARPRAEDTGLALDNSFLSPLLAILITRSYLDPQLCSLRRNFGRVSAPTKTSEVQTRLVERQEGRNGATPSRRRFSKIGSISNNESFPFPSFPVEKRRRKR